MENYKEKGLSEREIVESRKEYGSNALSHKKRQGFWGHYLSNFGDPIIKVLLAALAINVLFLFRQHDWYESIGIAFAVLLATLVSTLSEYGSESAFEKLQEESSAVQCRVKRGGKVCLVSLDDLVVGDFVLLQSGERIPADGILLHGELTVDQSALNGESKEITKHSDNLTNEASLSSVNRLFRGSVVCSGNGAMRVTAVGDATIYGSVAEEIQEETRESPLKLRLANLAKLLSKLGFVAAGVVAFADLFHRFVIENGYSVANIAASFRDSTTVIGNLLHAATLAITVVVVAVPEGLPMMITVVLSSNMRRMLKDNVLVRKLVGIETSGSINILFSDKTGTLTKGKPEVTQFVDAAGNSYAQLAQLQKTKLWDFVRLSCLYNTESEFSYGKVIGGNATDRALLSYIHGFQTLHRHETLLRHIPFDSSKKWSAAEIEGTLPMINGTPLSHLSLYKGAAEKLLPACGHYINEDGCIKPLNELSAALVSTRQKMEQDAMRVLVLALSSQPLSENPSDLVLLGLVGLRDELRPEVRRSVKLVKQAGIQTVMITGDGKQTASAIARAAGLLNDNDDKTYAVLSGEQLSKMSDETLRQKLPLLRVISRALPTDKSRLIRISQESGLVVGMTGDGVNDAPALKKADVGFAMGSGTEVAKQAGDIVVLDDNFSSVVKAVLYGRTIFKSIRKFIVFQLTMNLCAVGISIIGPFIGVETPVTVVQMLWINIIMDTLAGLAFAGEPPLLEYLEEPPKRRDEPILNRYMLNQILCTGGFTVALCVAFLKMDFSKLLFRYSTAPIYWMTAFFALFIFCGIFNSFNARTYRLNLLAHLRKNPLFIVIMVLVTLVQIGLIYYGGSLFRTAALSIHELLLVAGVSALVIPFDWSRKVLLRLFHRKGSL